MTKTAAIASLLAALLSATAHAQSPPVFLKLGCGYALYLPCYVDPAAYGEPRTVAGCRAAAARIGWRAECVEVK